LTARELWSWYSPPTPASRLRLLRLGVGAYAFIYLVTRAHHLNAVVDYPASSFAPVGIVGWLAAPLPAAWVYGLYAAAVIAGGAFTLGVAYRASAPLFALLLAWVLSYRHSWGMIFHTDNLLVLHVLLLACAPAGGSALPRARSAESTPVPDVSERYGWVPRAMCLVTVASYLVAGIAKLEHTGLAWAAGGALREQIAFDAIRKIELGSTYSPLGPWLLPRGWVFAPLSTFSLCAELLAPLALLGTRSAAVWCVCAWSFHVGVLALMAIAFPYPLSGCAFLAFFPLERGLPLLERLRFRVGEVGAKG
jgi:Vitamin K-dependent gamma-carboxylase